MAISGNVRDANEYYSSLKVGLAVCDVLDINPTKQQLAELFGREQEKDPVYVTKDADNNTLVNLDIWLQDVKSAQKFRLRIMLINKVNKVKSGKLRFIDNKGNTSYFLDSVDNLVGWMQENDPWEARVGEVELYKFMRAHQGNMKPKEITEFVIDWSKLMRGDVKELNDARQSPFATKVLVLVAVKVDNKESELKEYQMVYNGAFLPGDFIRYFRNKGTANSSQLTTFIRDTTSQQHGCPHFFGKDRNLAELHDYNPDENPLRSNEPLLAGQDEQQGDQGDLSSDY